MCAQECETSNSRRDCREDVYVPYVIAASEDRPVIVLFSSRKPRIVSKSKAAIELIDFVTYVLSAISFWFAFSPLVFFTCPGVWVSTTSAKPSSRRAGPAKTWMR